MSPPPVSELDQSLTKVVRQFPAALIALVLMAAIGFGSGIFESGYSGIRVQKSEFLTIIGPFTLCFVAAKVLEWGIKQMIRAGHRNENTN